MWRSRQPKLTDDDVCAYVVEFVGEHGYGPSYRDIAARFSVAPSTVKRRVDSLVRGGRVVRPPQGVRGGVTPPRRESRPADLGETATCRLVRCDVCGGVYPTGDAPYAVCPLCATPVAEGWS